MTGAALRGAWIAGALASTVWLAAPPLTLNEKRPGL